MSGDRHGVSHNFRTEPDDIDHSMRRASASDLEFQRNRRSSRDLPSALAHAHGPWSPSSGPVNRKHSRRTSLTPTGRRGPRTTRGCSAGFDVAIREYRLQFGNRR